MMQQIKVSLLVVLGIVVSGCASRGDYANVPVEEAGSQPGSVYQSSGYPPSLPTEESYPAPEASGAQDRPAAAPSAAPSNSAVVALLDTAQQQRQAGDYQRAAASLERAIRISPRNPQLYYELAQVRYLEGDYHQSKQLCQKAMSLAAGDKVLLEKCRALLSRLG